MMGDNRHNLKTAVTGDLYQKIIVGKPVFIWWAGTLMEKDLIKYDG
jgi:hypothetical protein